MFACRPAMQEHMRRLEVHCRALWARRLSRPGRGRQEAFLSNYLPHPLGGQASLRPFQRVRPQRPHCPPAQPPPPARPAGAPWALGRGLGTVRVLCPAHGAATCAACAATGQGIKYCCSLGHEGHRLAPAAQRAGARALRAWLQAPQQVPLPAPPPGTVLGSRGRESPQGSSEDEPPQAQRRVLPPAVLGRRRRPPRVGSSSDDDEPPRRRPPLRAGPSLSHSSRDFSPHHPRGYGGGGAGDGGVGQPQPQSKPRASSLSGSGLISPGGRWLRAPPLAASSATTSLPSPSPTMGTSRGGGGGQGRGRASLADVFGSISAALLDAARADGSQGDPPPPHERQGAAGWLRDGQGRGASPPPRDQGQQGAAGQGLGQQGAASLSVVQAQGQPGAAVLDQGCQGAAGWPRDGQGRGASPPLSDQGQHAAAGRGLGQHTAAPLFVVQAQGQPQAAPLGQGCQGQGQGRGQGGSAPPPARRSPPPSLRGRAGRAQERGSATRGGRAAHGADRQGRPAQRRNAAARLPPRGGGLLSLSFTRQVQSSGGGSAQPPTAAPASAGADWGAHSPRSGQGRSSEDPT